MLLISTWYKNLIFTSQKLFEINLGNWRSSCEFVYSLIIIVYVYLHVSKSVAHYMCFKYTPEKLSVKGQVCVGSLTVMYMFICVIQALQQTLTLTTIFA